MTRDDDEKCQHGRLWATCGTCIGTLYCGCCGEEGAEWCFECRAHIGTHGAPWERTYLAIHGVTE